MKKILILLKGANDLILAEKYKEKYDITVVSCKDAFVDYFEYRGYKTYSATEFFDGLIPEKFDMVIGNPPYGKGSHMCVRYINTSAEYSDNIHIIVPKTLLKDEYINKINLNFHLVSDVVNIGENFPKNLPSHTLHWQKKNIKRELIPIFKMHKDFRFVKKSEANVFIGSSGDGPCGKVKTENFDHYTETHHYLYIENQSVINNLKSLQEQFINRANEYSSGMRNITKHEIITIYMRNFP